MDYNILIEDFKGAYNNFACKKFYQANDAFAKNKITDPESFIESFKKAVKFSDSKLAKLAKAANNKITKTKINIDVNFKQVFNEFNSASIGTNLYNKSDIFRSTSLQILATANIDIAYQIGINNIIHNLIEKYSDANLKKIINKKLAKNSYNVALAFDPQLPANNAIKALKNKQGDYFIKGDRNNIVAGDHDLGENILYVTLARLEDKSLGLFVVPKIIIDKKGDLKNQNKIECKYSDSKNAFNYLIASDVKFKKAQAYLITIIDKENNIKDELKSELNFINIIIGLSILERLNQDFLNDKSSSNNNILIKNYIAEQRSLITVIRSLILNISFYKDVIAHDEKNKDKEKCINYINMVLPNLKIFLSDILSRHIINLMQIAPSHNISQGLNFLQIIAADNIAQATCFVTETLPINTGKILRSFFQDNIKFIEKNKEGSAISPYTKNIYGATKNAQQASLWIAANGLGNPDNAIQASINYAKILSIAILADIWGKIILNSANENNINQGNYYLKKIVPEQYSLLANLVEGAKIIEKTAKTGVN